MPKQKDSILVIPPKNKRILYFRIRLSIVILVFLFFSIGVAGYFIPFNSVSLNVAEINQKKHVTEQNKKLLLKIKNMREMFIKLKRRIDTLSQTKKNVENLVSIDSQPNKSSDFKDTLFENMDLDELLNYINITESFYYRFTEKIKDNNSYINSVPIIKPIVCNYVITSRFGKVRDPFTGDMKWHYGIDFAAKRETPIIATASGVVDMVQNHYHWGQRIRIRHGFGFSTVYAHLGKVHVYKGKYVKKGQRIATVGLSGLTTGPHLHYEIHYDGEPIDPEELFIPDTLISVTMAR